jgi:hypothetical protein
LAQAPTIGTLANNSQNGQLTLTFTAGGNGGKNITNYKYSTDGTTYTAFSPAQTTSPLTISGLTNGTSYTARLKAVTANGDGAASTASNSATPSANITMNFLVVAGGGGGNSDSSGGGGAGGLRSTMNNTGGLGSLESTLEIAKGTNYTVTVGAGGAYAAAGVDSVFSTITSTGGGRGGGNASAPTYTAGAGGSGGGASGGGSSDAGGVRTASPVQGFDGGRANIASPYYPGGGGGGAGQTPARPAGGGSDGGTGGNGVTVSITGSSLYYAGGGGGFGNTSGTGGSGGGGTGGTTGSTNGTANLGGGAGGGNSSYQRSGGSGVVILRWLTSAGSITVGGGLTADSTGTDGSFSYKRFTAGSGNVSWA